MLPRLLICLFLMLAAGLARAEAVQDLEAIRATAESFVQGRLAEQPQKAEVQVGQLDPRLRLAACGELEAFLPPGGRLAGAANVGVRCLAPVAWSLFVPVRIVLRGMVVVAARPLLQGQVLTPEDVTLQEMDVTRQQAGVLTSPEEVGGKILSVSVAAGYAIRADMLKIKQVVRQGQTVQILAHGPGFTVRSEGKAMNNAAVGESVTVRVRSGQLVHGVAREDGRVEVPF